MRTALYKKDGQQWSIPEAFYRISIKLIIKDKNDHLLVMQDIHDKLYEIPGGGLDWEETHRQAAVRELQEELGVELKHMSAKPFAREHSQHPDGFRVIKYYYFAEITGTPINNEPERFIHAWVDKQQFKTFRMASDESPIQQHANTIW